MDNLCQFQYHCHHFPSAPHGLTASATCLTRCWRRRSRLVFGSRTRGSAGPTSIGKVARVPTRALRYHRNFDDMAISIYCMFFSHLFGSNDFSSSCLPRFLHHQIKSVVVDSPSMRGSCARLVCWHQEPGFVAPTHLNDCYPCFIVFLFIFGFYQSSSDMYCRKYP